MKTRLLLGSGLLLMGLSLVACQSTQPAPGLHRGRQADYMQKRQRYNPKAAEVNMQLGVAYLRQGNHDRAKSKLLLARQQDPSSPLILNAWAYYQEVTGEPQLAEKFYLKALNHVPEDGRLHNNYGTFLCRQQRFNEAEKQFLLAVHDQNYMSPGEAYENAGLCAIKHKNSVKAEQFFAKALQKQPDLANALLEMAKIRYDRQDYRAARHYLQRFSQVATSTAESLALGVRIAQRMGDTNQANVYTLLLRNEFPHSKELQDLVAREQVT